MSGKVTHPAAQPVRSSSGVAAPSLGASHVATAHPADCHRPAVAAAISADPAHHASCPYQLSETACSNADTPAGFFMLTGGACDQNLYETSDCFACFVR